ncbi:MULTISPECIES: hypothetical protein [Xenorhabdus]|uniref:hypothetical protein n=1 Tax=Xenorhabdus TaxID=626 RepID=UPI000649A290|nr:MULTISPECIES: hypothetical protein [Xenorhabdus]KLU14275.1 hypothetical protein AAY47_17435 [Xenorhabdus griffiniae]KOP35016.1 hypothetical protein AFK69_01375 [Xenorhabdus sp. GDc328]
MRNLLIPTIFLLAGCGDATENSVQIEPEKAPIPVFSITTDNATINQLLPAIRHLLPGLDKYSEQFQNKVIEQNRFLTIKFRIPDNAQIPVEYMASGHNCFIEINDDQTGIKIPKSACQATLFDQKNVLPDSDYWVYFYPDDLAYKPYDFSLMPDTERIDTVKNYLDKMAKTIESVQQKNNWIAYDYPNYGRQFRQIEYEGKRFLSQDVIQPYDSCQMAGSNAQIWWSEQVNSIKQLTSDDSKKIDIALKKIEDIYDAYQKNAADCLKDIKSAPLKSEPREILPPTPDNKPPRAGCLMVFKPEDTTEWSCPI